MDRAQLLSRIQGINTPIMNAFRQAAEHNQYLQNALDLEIQHRFLLNPEDWDDKDRETTRGWLADGPRDGWQEADFLETVCEWLRQKYCLEDLRVDAWGRRKPRSESTSP